MHVWLLVSTDTAWVRLPGALATVGCVVLTSVLALRLSGPLAAAVSGSLLAANGLIIHQSLIARSFPAVLLLIASLALVTFRLLEQPTRRRAAAATALGVLAALTHLFAGGLPAAALLGAAVLVAVRRGRGLTACLIPFTATSAAMLVLGAVASRSAGVQLAWLERPGLAAPLYSLYQAEGGRAATWSLLVLAAAALVHHRREAFVWVLLAWGTAGPVFLMAYSLLVSPVYVTTYTIASMPPLALLAALGVITLRPPEAGRLLQAGPPLVGSVLTALVLTAGAPFASADVRDDDPRTIAAFVARHVRPGDVVVYTGDMARPLFERYLTPATPVVPRDVLLVESAVASDTLDGRSAHPGSSRELVAARRVWLLATLEDGDWPRSRSAQRAALTAVTRDRTPSLTLEAGTTRGTLFVGGADTP
jgi:hypothetical protein